MTHACISVLRSIILFELVFILVLTTTTVLQYDFLRSRQIFLYFKRSSNDSKFERPTTSLSKGKVNDEASNRNCNYITFNINPYVRTGNRMFVYASFFGIAKANNKIPFIRYSNFTIDKGFKLSVPYMNISDQEINKFSPVPGTRLYEFNGQAMNLSCDKNYTMNGYRASWKYFNKYNEDIKREFRFLDHIDAECNQVLQNITVKYNVSRRNCILVGAHMRREDFVTKQQFGFVAGTKEYLHKAIKFFEGRFSNKSCLLFLILGNDFGWNIENSPNQTNIIPIRPRSNFVDMCILSRCNHTIFSSGTFGWWSAYLAGGIATRMIHQCTPKSWLCSHMIYENYINNKWPWHAL